ncbi:MAG: hypothetical protein ABIG39_03800 [Candidatus Micrarchaeota archaeon]
MEMKKGQGAFEYMMSYGWAVLVIVVLAVVLWNLGVFNPSTATQASGFSVIRPVAWNFEGAGYGSGNSLYASNATVALSNIAGIDLTIALNGTSASTSSTAKFSKPGAASCGWYGNVNVTDEVGTTITVTWDATNNYGKIGLPAGGQAVVTGVISGPLGTVDQNYTCGGPSGGAYRWTISYQTALDQYNIQHSDAGSVTGKFQ